MPFVTHLAIRNLRILRDVEIDLASQTNLFIGPNASGKTTVLEALHIAARGRSFREAQWPAIISERKESLRVVARVQNRGRSIPVGIERDRHHSTIKINGETQRSSKALLEQLPVQLIQPDSHRLIEQGPIYRRQFLDWGVFHVEQRFYHAWQIYRRALKQRNAALKTDRRGAALEPWEHEMSAAAGEIDRYRSRYIEKLTPYLEALGLELLQIEGLRVRYHKGWRDTDLSEVLEASRGSDAAQGYTRAGPHRADLELNAGDYRAAQRVSRGQQKALIFALILAQTRLFTECTRQTPILLVDDLGAELDNSHLRRIWQALRESRSQLLITGTDLETRLPIPSADGAMFHVERGEVTRVL